MPCLLLTEIVVLAGKSHPSFYEDPFWIDDKGGGKRRPNQERPDAFSRLSYAEEDPEWMDCKNGWESQVISSRCSPVCGLALTRQGVGCPDPRKNMTSMFRR